LKAIHEHKEAVSDRHVFVPRVALTRVIGLVPRLIGSTDRRDFHSAATTALPPVAGRRACMNHCLRALLLIAATCWGGAWSVSRANDSSAELGVGGLTFTKNAEISIESEQLTITLDAVTVRYTFLNHSTKPVTLTVAFPLPDIDLADAANIAFPAADPLNYVGFSTKINGKPISFVTNQQAFLNEKNVTAKLTEMGIPTFPVGAQQLKINELPQKTRERAVAEGLLVESGTNDKGLPLYDATWTLKTSVVRQQTFPPGKPILVEHRYRSSVGMSFDSILRPSLRQSKALRPEVQRYKTTYCASDDFLKLVDGLESSDKARRARIVERRINYVLKSGANWAGPIKDFHLVVDKGQPDRIVSFCGQGIQQISPTQVELRAADFTPTQDLHILILGPK
jgi:hypothetical protein